MSERPSIEEKPDSQGSLADGLTEADLERWRNMAEHGKTKAARDIATAILERHAELRSAKAEGAHA